jgi:hypothetical protein
VVRVYAGPVLAAVVNLHPVALVTDEAAVGEDVSIVDEAGAGAEATIAVRQRVGRPEPAAVVGDFALLVETLKGRSCGRHQILMPHLKQNGRPAEAYGSWSHWLGLVGEDSGLSGLKSEVSTPSLAAGEPGWTTCLTRTFFRAAGGGVSTGPLEVRPVAGSPCAPCRRLRLSEEEPVALDAWSEDFWGSSFDNRERIQFESVIPSPRAVLIHRSRSSRVARRRTTVSSFM